jgi:hypothetical protein
LAPVFSGKFSGNGKIVIGGHDKMSGKAVHLNNNNNNNMIASFVSVIEDAKTLSLSDEKERSPQHQPSSPTNLVSTLTKERMFDNAEVRQYYVRKFVPAYIEFDNTNFGGISFVGIKFSM